MTLQPKIDRTRFTVSGLTGYYSRRVGVNRIRISIDPVKGKVPSKFWFYAHPLSGESAEECLARLVRVFARRKGLDTEETE